MKNPTVSVIVPVYKVEKYLQKCIDSICMQSYPDLEIILVDDGSPDYCGNICDKNAEKDGRIQVLHKENGGLSSARNAGLDISVGEYIAFVDADDILHSEFVKVLVGLCEENGCDIAQCDFLTIAEDSIMLPLNPQSSLTIQTGKQAVHNLCTGKDDTKYSIAWNKVYKRELFNEIRYPLGRIHEDEFTSYRILWKANKVAVTNQYLYYYLQRPESITGSKYSLKRLDVLDAFRERIDFLKENKLEEESIATIHQFVDLLERTRASLKMNVDNSEDICTKLSKEQMGLNEQLSQISIETTEQMNEKPTQTPVEKGELFQPKWTTDNCPYQKEAKVAIYGAGRWGNAYYQWICENKWGDVVGWVDNFWSVKHKGYPITPLDSLMTISYDYVLIAIENKDLQKEIMQNLMSWGIPEEKILAI